MEELLKSIENEISNSLNTVQNLASNGNRFEILSKKIESFSDELERLNKTIPKISNEYNKTNLLSKSEVTQLKEFIDKSMSNFIKELGIPSINTDYKFDTKIL